MKRIRAGDGNDTGYQDSDSTDVDDGPLPKSSSWESIVAKDGPRLERSENPDHMDGQDINDDFKLDLMEDSITEQIITSVNELLRHRRSRANRSDRTRFYNSVDASTQTHQTILSRVLAPLAEEDRPRFGDKGQKRFVERCNERLKALAEISGTSKHFYWDEEQMLPTCDSLEPYLVAAANEGRLDSFIANTVHREPSTSPSIVDEEEERSEIVQISPDKDLATSTEFLSEHERALLKARLAASPTRSKDWQPIRYMLEKYSVVRRDLFVATIREANHHTKRIISQLQQISSPDFRFPNDIAAKEALMSLPRNILALSGVFSRATLEGADLTKLLYPHDAIWVEKRCGRDAWVLFKLAIPLSKPQLHASEAPKYWDGLRHILQRVVQRDFMWGQFDLGDDLLAIMNENVEES